MSDKGFGFIKELNGASDYFFHKSFLEKGYRFDALNEGDAVEFNLRPSKNKPGQQEAFDVKPTGKVAAVQTTQRPHGHQVQPEERHVLPYGFVPITIDNATTDEPVLHDGSSGGELLSGEILCELEALTPLLPGNARYAVEDADRQRLRQWGFGELKDDKQIAEPLRLPDGRVVIAGTSLKGMIRQSLSALTSAPMERVGERHFTYRPNLDFNKLGTQERYIVRPARILSEKGDDWEIEVFDNAQAALFVRKNAESVIYGASSNGLIKGNVSGVEVEMKPRKNKPPIKTSHLIRSKGHTYFDHRLVTYRGGIDGEGLLATAFNDGKRGPFTYDLALVPQQAACTLQLEADVYKRYLDHQTRILSNEKVGHLTAHPLGSKFNADQLKQVKAAICQNRAFSIGQLIYVELTADASGKVSPRSKVVSCGHHFRYRWAYTSSIREQNGQPRACLTPISDEQTADKPERLTGARLLFGYVRDDKTTIGQGVFERLAGRIAINHAVSEGTPRFLGDPGTGFCIPLKILGQPKPSAWEFYLRQPDDTKEPLKTYGDLPDDPGGELAGRKFYRHQKGTHEADIKADTDEIISSDQATLARFISQPGTRFRFAIRFARLRPWELGALLAVLEPHRLAPEGKADDYAHKLGLGRPLGMGSVRISPSALRIRRENETAFLDDAALDITLDEAMRTLRAKLDDGVEKQWLDAHRMVPNQRLNYPVAKTKVDGNLVETIYAWHTDVRREYSQLRRQKSPDWSALAKKITREREADDPKSSST
jgi:CRISPR-associated protein (TIGR03986 family)